MHDDEYIQVTIQAKFGNVNRLHTNDSKTALYITTLTASHISRKVMLFKQQVYINLYGQGL